MNAVQSTVAAQRVSASPPAEGSVHRTSLRRAAVKAILTDNFGGPPFGRVASALATGFQVGTAATATAVVGLGAAVGIGYGLENVIGPALFQTSASLLGPAYFIFGIPTLACLMGMIGAIGLNGVVQKYQGAHEHQKA